VLNDVAVAIRDLHETRPDLRVFVADTDAHQGNGTHAIFRGDERVFTYSIHGGRNYPSAKEPGDLDVGLPREVSGDDYLAALADTLPSALTNFPCDLVIWISGADVHEQDRFGQMRLSTEQLIERDRMVLSWCRERHLPVAVLYGGGYHDPNGLLIGIINSEPKGDGFQFGENRVEEKSICREGKSLARIKIKLFLFKVAGSEKGDG